MLTSALKLVRNPITQFDDATDGLGYISELLVRCRLIEDTYNLASINTDQRYLVNFMEQSGVPEFTGDFQAYPFHFYFRVNNPLSQLGDANLMMRCSTPWSRLENQLKDKSIELYCQVLKYQIHLARQYSRPAFFRLLRDCAVADEWLGMLTNLKETEATIDKILSTLDNRTLKVIGNKISNLQDTADRSLALLKETKASIEARESFFAD